MGQKHPVRAYVITNPTALFEPGRVIPFTSAAPVGSASTAAPCAPPSPASP
ncbi:hypothetical protein [Streptomyces sp900116325]|uniref:hypothetical protein n=1 Tax=Streptomyces sp. 900116325 TaxID=3154295 RepID=UPI0033B915FF